MNSKLASSWESSTMCFGIDPRHRPANSGLALTTKSQPHLPTGVYDLWPWQTTDSMEKQLLHGFPLPLPCSLNWNCSFCATPPESTAAGSACWPISSGWDSVRERGRDIRNRPPTLVGVVLGSRWVETLTDKWKQSATLKPRVQSKLGRNIQRRDRTKVLGDRWTGAVKK